MVLGLCFWSKQLCLGCPMNGSISKFNTNRVHCPVNRAAALFPLIRKQADLLILLSRDHRQGNAKQAKRGLSVPELGKRELQISNISVVISVAAVSLR